MKTYWFARPFYPGGAPQDLSYFIHHCLRSDLATLVAWVMNTP